MSVKDEFFQRLGSYMDEVDCSGIYENFNYEHTSMAISEIVEIKRLYRALLEESSNNLSKPIYICNLSKLQCVIKKINEYLETEPVHSNLKNKEIYLEHFLNLAKNINNYVGEQNYMFELLSTIPYLKSFYLNSYYESNRNIGGFGYPVHTAMKSRDKNTLLFRGHSSKNFDLIPSLYRKDSHYINEDLMYKETYMNAYDQFASAKNHLEKLTIMQHYGLPTRLLDLTRNPLVALYFAVTGSNLNEEAEILVFNIKNKEIKYYDSDSVNIISALSVLNYSEKQRLFKLAIIYIAKLFKYARKATSSSSLKKINNSHINKVTPQVIEDFNKESIVKKLNREVEKESGMYLKEIHPVTILSIFAVYPMPNNNRISRQQGLFLVPGILNPSSVKQHIQKLRFYKHKEFKKDSVQEFLNNLNPDQENLKMKKYPLLLNALKCAHIEFIPEFPRYIIRPSDKQTLLKELDLFGINESTIYPDMSNIINRVKETYNYELDFNQISKKP